MESYQYCIFRLVPKVEREEFVNIGVILYCPGQNYLDMKWEIDEKILSVFPSVNLKMVDKQMISFKKTCIGDIESGEISKLKIDERFEWLTSPKSTIIQNSSVHPGLCINAEKTLIHIYENFVK